MKKKCSKCGISYDEGEFNWKIKGVKRSYHCKHCSRAYVKKHYDLNQKYYSDKARKRDLVIRHEYQKYVANYLLYHPCVDCGESNVLVLEFDHIDHDTKISEIGTMARNGLSFQKIINEIDKCQVRCANCHRIKTAYENNSWKLKYAPVAQLD